MLIPQLLLPALRTPFAFPSASLPPYTAQTKLAMQRRAVNLLANGALARTFAAWRWEAAAMAAKREAFARKQQALREAALIGDAILRQRRHVAVVCLGRVSV